jgi:hypothetical protein
LKGEGQGEGEMVTKYKIGQVEKDGWKLVKRRSRVELWQNPKNNNYSIELFEHVRKIDDEWLMHKKITGKNRAHKKYQLILDILGIT